MSSRPLLLCGLLFSLGCGDPPPPAVAPSAPPPPEAEPAPTAEPTAEPAPFDESQKPRGHLASAKIHKVVRAHFGPMQACYEEGLRRDPHLTGKVRVRMVIAEDGRVATASSEPTPSTSNTTLRVEGNEPLIRDPAVIECIVQAFRALSFPAPEGGIVIATYPVIFSVE